MALSAAWRDILSELFVNLAAGWFAVVFIEPQLGGEANPGVLLVRAFFGVISLIVAKHLREEVGNHP